jgi:hypothetical protein
VKGAIVLCDVDFNLCKVNMPVVVSIDTTKGESGTPSQKKGKDYEGYHEIRESFPG